MAQIQPRQNLLGVKGWVYGGKYQLERYLYILHRVTGLGLLLFIMFHFTATTVFRIQGRESGKLPWVFLRIPISKLVNTW